MMFTTSFQRDCPDNEVNLVCPEKKVNEASWVRLVPKARLASKESAVFRVLWVLLALLASLQNEAIRDPQALRANPAVI